MKIKTKRMVLIMIFVILMLNVQVMATIKIIKTYSQSITFEDKVVEGLYNLETRINVSEYKLTTAEAMTKFWRVISDNPRLFFVELVNNTIACSYFLDENGNKNANNLILNYEADVTSEKVQEQLNLFDLEADKILSKVKPEMKDYEKVMIVHDYMVLSYGYDIYTGGITAYDMIVNKIGVCQAYASAFKHFMDTLGIESTIVTSGAMNHAWNMVKIDGEWYHVDITWDDPMPDLVGRINHNYLLLSDEKMRASNYHSWDAKYQATSTKYDNFFWRNVNSEIYIQENDWYYLDAKGEFKTYNEETQESKLSVNIEVEMWAYWDETTGRGSETTFWMGNYSSVIVYDNKVYYNTPTQIYKMNLDGSCKESVLYVDPIKNQGYVYGLKIIGNELYCSIKKDYTNPDRLVKIIDLPKLIEEPVSEWENTLKEIEKAEKGQVLEVKVQNYILPKEVLETAKNKGVILEISVGNYTWKINDINNVVDLNTEISTNLGIIPNEKISLINYQYQVLELNLSHEGEFGFDAVIEYYVGEEYAGKTSNLYYYNDKLNRMEKIYSSQVSEEGKIEIKINHASSYAVIISEKPICKGDLNLSGGVDNSDLVDMCRYMVRDIELKEQSLTNGDINQDGEVTLVDIAYLKEFIMGNFEKLDNIFE